MIARDEDGTFSKWAWPGGYPVYHLCADCEPMCADCANDPANPIEVAEGEERMHTGDEQWTLIASEVNWEDAHLYCSHCNQRIESAYAEPEEKPMQGIKFSFDDETLFDGFAAGGTWNGFDNVKVTPQVAAQIDLHFREMAKRGGYGYNDEDDISRIPVGDDGLID